MKIQCPNCGQDVVIKGLGRKPLNITVKNICDALEKYYKVPVAAEELGCSRAYIYKVLKDNNLNIENIVKKNSG